MRLPKVNAKGEVVPTAGSLLATAWPAAERHFAAATAASESMAEVIVLPTVAKVDEESFVGDLAAGVEATRPAMLQRLPLSFEPEARFAVASKLSYGEASSSSGAL